MREMPALIACGLFHPFQTSSESTWWSSVLFTCSFHGVLPSCSSYRLLVALSQPAEHASTCHHCPRCSAHLSTQCPAAAQPAKGQWCCAAGGPRQQAGSRAPGLQSRLLPWIPALSCNMESYPGVRGSHKLAQTGLAARRGLPTWAVHRARVGWQLPAQQRWRAGRAVAQGDCPAPHLLQHICLEQRGGPCMHCPTQSWC